MSLFRVAMSLAKDSISMKERKGAYWRNNNKKEPLPEVYPLYKWEMG